MDATQIEMVLARVKFHVKIFWLGFCRTICVAAIASLIAMAVFWFFSVAKLNGWMAVFKFSGACILFVEGFRQMYLIGRNKNGRSGKREGRDWNNGDFF